jgi:threonine/homoserine/homoserine lactone efflux protein
VGAIGIERRHHVSVMERLLPFLAVAALLIVTPGPDTALTIRNALIGGRRGGILTGAGVATGQLIWALATCLGIGALLQAYQPAYVALKLAGAAYLIYLGAHSLLRALRDHGRIDAPHGSPTRRRSGSRAYRQGVLSNLGNPKMAVFFVSLLPQFVGPSTDTFFALLVLGLTFSVMTFAWLTAYSVVVGKAGDVFRRNSVRRGLDGLTGAVLIALGLRVATEGT